MTVTWTKAEVDKLAAKYEAALDKMHKGYQAELDDLHNRWKAICSDYASDNDRLKTRFGESSGRGVHDDVAAAAKQLRGNV